MTNSLHAAKHVEEVLIFPKIFLNLLIFYLGVQYRNVTCAGRRTLEPADRSLCDANNEPTSSQKCAEVPCEAQWVPYPWNNCSAPCGEGGTQTREIACQQVISNGYPSLVDESECAGQPKPPQQQTCNKGRVCAKWHIGPWKPVSTRFLRYNSLQNL